MDKNKQQYGMLTALSMVVGIVIGSGIFFQTDNMLVQANGNTILVVAAFLLIGIGVIFGALVIANYATETDEEGGLVKYGQLVIGNNFAFFLGWMLVAIYMPALVALLARVASGYLLQILGIDSSYVWFATIGITLIVIASNYFGKRFSGFVQTAATFLKFIPIVLVVLFGFFGSAQIASSTAQGAQNTDIFGLLLAVAFSFDGWYIATSISHEVRNSKKVMPRALVIGTIIIMVTYLAYVLGVTQILPPSDIVSLGDEYIGQISLNLFGNEGFILIFVFISVYGGVNGLTLAYFRLTHSLVENGLMRNVGNIKQINKKTGVSTKVVVVSTILIAVFIMIDYLSANTTGFFEGFSIGDLPIILIYIFNTILVLGIIPRALKGKASKINILYALIFAVISMIVVVGSLLNGGIVYVVFSTVILLLGFTVKEKFE